jgi:hypothetical protein
MTAERRKDNQPETAHQKRTMTKRTYFALRGTQKDILRQLAELGSENDSGHARSELHDSNASVQAKNMLNARLRSIGSLDEKEIDFISRPEDVSRVVLGTKVALEYEADGEKDTVKYPFFRTRKCIDFGNIVV